MFVPTERNPELCRFTSANGSQPVQHYGRMTRKMRKAKQSCVSVLACPRVPSLPVFIIDSSTADSEATTVVAAYDVYELTADSVSSTLHSCSSDLTSHSERPPTCCIANCVPSRCLCISPSVALDEHSAATIEDNSVLNLSNVSNATSTRGARFSAKKRAAKRKREQRLDDEASVLFRSIAPTTRKRKKHMHLKRHFPPHVLNMTNNLVHNLTDAPFNLADNVRVLSSAERVVLSLGPQCILPPVRLSQDEICSVFSKFMHNVRCKHYFLSNPSHQRPYTRLDKLVKAPSVFIPPVASVHVESYLKYVGNNLLSRTMDNIVYNSRRRKFLEYKYNSHMATRKFIMRIIANLRKDTSVLFKKSDKNLGLCVVPSVWYDEQAMLHLCDANTYQNVTHIPTVSNVFSTLHTNVPVDCVSSAVYNFIFQSEVCCISPTTTPIPLAKFYMLPKIHKLPAISTRPIVASMKSVTYNASKYVDYILQPVMRSFKQVLNSPVDLLRHLNITSFSQSCTMFTADVTSLYPSIDITDGLRKVGGAIHLYNSKFKQCINCVCIINMCEWVLRNNYISYGSTTWVQLRGTAMGTPMAVVFANIYIAMLESDAFNIFFTKYPRYACDSVLLYVRFIDDILCILETVEQSAYLLALLNTMHDNIRLTDSSNKDSVDFLDITIFKGPLFMSSSLFDIKPFQKQMNAYLYISMFSHHNPAVFKSFIQSEIRRYTRNSTCNLYVEQLCSVFEQRLLARGYGAQFLADVMRVRYVRKDILFPPRVYALYDTKYHQYHPRLSTAFPFNPPDVPYVHICSSLQYIFKIPYTGTYAPRVLASVLRYDNIAHSLLHDPVVRIPSLQQHPVICYNRTASIGDLLISAQREYEFPF